jgi:hypothetical protein
LGGDSSLSPEGVLRTASLPPSAMINTSPYENKHVKANDRVVICSRHSRYFGLEGVVYSLLPLEGCALLEVPLGSISPFDQFDGTVPKNAANPSGNLLLIAVGWITGVSHDPKTTQA